MDIIAKARRLESNIARRLDRAAKDLVRSRSHDPLEIVHAIVALVEEQIQPSGRGRRVFPFTRVAVSLAAPSKDTRARFEAVFETAPTLRDRIGERLAAAGCPNPPPSVSIEYVARAHKNWRQPQFDIRFRRAAEDNDAVDAPAPADARIELTVTRGTADRRTYSFAAGRIHLGRGREVRDVRHRLLRANDVAFAEGADEINRTVSRQHAHIVFDESHGEFRLRDDGSAHGTAVVRDRKPLTVPRGARGVRLQADDEIVLGDARMRVRLVSARA
jgi:hypothetical protein